MKRVSLINDINEVGSLPFNPYQFKADWNQSAFWVDWDHSQLKIISVLIWKNWYFHCTSRSGLLVFRSKMVIVLFNAPNFIDFTQNEIMRSRPRMRNKLTLFAIWKQDSPENMRKLEGNFWKIVGIQLGNIWKIFRKCLENVTQYDKVWGVPSHKYI